MTEPILAKSDKYGRYYPLFGKKLYSTSGMGKILKAIGLEYWTKRTIATGLAQHPDLLEQVRNQLPGLAAAQDKESKKPYNRLVDEACQEALDRNNRAAERGTNVHKATELWDEGKSIEEIREFQYENKYTGEMMCFDDEEITYLNQYIKLRKEFELEPVYIERTAYHRTSGNGVGHAGSLDRIYRTPRIEGCVIGDVKTGSEVQTSVARQLAGYANSEGMIDPDTGEIEAMPDDLRTDIALVIHLGPDHGYVHTIDISKAWNAFQATVLLFDYLAFDEPYVVGEPWVSLLDEDEEDVA